jgi:predicted phosphodiesterase
VKIHVLSDLHTEFVDFQFPDASADLVVLAGDIGVRKSGFQFAKKLPLPSVYVAGNHEYYGAALPRLTEKLQAEASGTNVAFLENEERVIGGVRFLGCTLWSDFSILGPGRRQLAM